MTLEEVSFALNIPLNTVKTRLRRARRTLGIALEEGGEDHARSNP
jgi:DNA-directed RNA polymerase specialized sigma24 family protein